MHKKYILLNVYGIGLYMLECVHICPRRQVRTKCACLREYNLLIIKMTY